MLIGNVHLVAGGSERIEGIAALVEREGIAVKGNPDVYMREYKHFGVDEARELRERSAARALRGRRVFVICAASLTAEAQNALLKTFEEASDALYFLVTPAPHSLLPTIRSRALMLEVGAIARESALDAKKFLAATPAARLDMLKPLLEKGDDEKRDLGGIIAFLSSLEVILAKRLTEETRAGAKAVYRARAHIGDKGALLKPLLEQVALLSPRA